MTVRRDSGRGYENEDVKVRPGPRSRPRTRVRPRHADAVDGFVVGVDRGRFTCMIDGTTVVAVQARELGRHGVVVGDRVSVVGDVSGDPDALARIVRVAARSSILRRTADDVGGQRLVERPLVANADQLVIVCAVAEPEPRTGFVDRCLVAAYDAEIEPILCLTKVDIDKPDAILDYYVNLLLPHVLCRRDEEPSELRAALVGHISVLVGQSGVGKSTLINRLVPAAQRAVGEVSAVGKGRHTSTSSVAFPLPGAGESWIIDTPGVRSFGLAHVTPDSLLHGFPDLVEASVNCPPGCEHSATSPQCGLDALVAAGEADPRRLASFRRLLTSRGATEDWD